MKKVHFISYKKPQFNGTLCGIFSDAQLSRHVDKVTCKNCKKLIGKDFDSSDFIRLRENIIPFMYLPESQKKLLHYYQEGLYNRDYIIWSLGKRGLWNAKVSNSFNDNEILRLDFSRGLEPINLSDLEGKTLWIENRFNVKKSYQVIGITFDFKKVILKNQDDGFIKILTPEKLISPLVSYHDGSPVVKVVSFK